MNSNFDAIANGIQTVLTYLADKPDAFWYMVGLTLSTAVVVSTITEIIIRRFAHKWDIKMGKQLISTILAFLAFLGSSTDAIISNAPFFASPILQRFSWILSLAYAYHHFIGAKLSQSVIDSASKWSGAEKAPIIAPVTEIERKPIPAVSSDIWSK